uniref:ER membrane protein complex subunit 6 n=1 Tax=Kwoniella bestiolae CBS 10118 TaxID=1296100 RepID=A0A1B9FU78_9TREE|nr:hypothetical protein I302_07965 [Kwoniella bestiolae CBS 10118]OCF22318.1 hypothetical protein I302_07965 [Kwoniella bestiolae CBS 10118]
MNPAAPPPTGAHLAPDASPLHPPSVMHNTRILSSLGTVSVRSLDSNNTTTPTRIHCREGDINANLITQLSACFSGLISGILGLTNLSGFCLYLLSSVFTSVVLLVLKCNFNVKRYIPQSHSNSSPPGGDPQGGGKSRDWKGYWALTGINQENLLGFLLFWIGSFALIHGELGSFLGSALDALSRDIGGRQ